jgi:DNA-binding transcriptional LysR family regulator
LERLGESKSVDDLRRYPCAACKFDFNTRRVWRLGEQVFDPKVVLNTNGYALARSRAVAGQALTELPPILAREKIAVGRLWALLPEHPMPELMINLLYPSYRHPSSIVRANLDFCQEQVPNHLWCGVAPS